MADSLFSETFAHEVEDSLLFSEEVLYDFQKEAGIELIKSDYTLDSPLLRDDPDRYKSFLLKGTYGFLADSIPSIVTSSLEYIKTNHPLDWGLFDSGANFHKFLARNIFSTKHRAPEGDELIDFAGQESSLPIETYKAFWRAVMKNDELVFPPDSELSFIKTLEPLFDQNRQIRYDLSWFWKFHKITLMMNSSGPKERACLWENDTKVRWIKELKGGGFCVTYKDRALGEILIFPGGIIIKESRQIWVRNMVLLVKDTCIARFASKVSVLNRPSLDLPRDMPLILEEFYQKGDKILSILGNEAYDVFKLIEAHCNLQLSEMSRRHRPLIPRVGEFSEFLADQREELFQKTGVCEIEEFFRIISTETRPQVLVIYFSTFRHYGHPFIDYYRGLEKLHKQVTAEKEVDDKYMQLLASDLAFAVLRSQFRKNKVWYVNKDQVPKSHMLYQHIKKDTWPTPKQIHQMDGQWHRLPLSACFEVPKLIDLSVIYSDKSHSMDRPEVLEHVRNRSPRPIPSRRVLQTALETESLDVQATLGDIDENGLPGTSLVIGLKPKERELKIFGRYFAMLSWKLRTYFVLTEFLIKEHFVPLFSGLTMADDMTSLLKKLMDGSAGQGLDDYSSITISNHLDFEKWNNHQRHSSTFPVFEVMDKFLGFKRVISRTHQFFENSLIYFSNRPDLMQVQGESLISKEPGKRMCWEGQAGGLEGLRQKGWTIVGYLILLREARTRNTRISILAQGDNQVVCTNYRPPSGLSDTDLTKEIEHIIENNANIMRNVRNATASIGLLINESETIQSTDYMIYGKLPIFRGGILTAEQKVWARMTCSTNDQIPSLASTFATISTGCLSVSHKSEIPTECQLLYIFFGLFAHRVLRFHNPVIQCPIPYSVDRSTEPEEYSKLLVRLLFLDPSLGGATGTCLSRFLIRSFPDPVTEGLSFWKAVHGHTRNESLRSAAISCGYPALSFSKSTDFPRLLEDPTSLNINKGATALTILKEAVRKALEEDADSIKNQLVSEAMRDFTRKADYVELYLETVKPCFPRFLSEFYSATILGIAETIAGLFQNSRTIRSMFQKRMRREIATLLLNSEARAMRSLVGRCHSGTGFIWVCSSSRADELRLQSWGEKIFGATIPHPLEIVGDFSVAGNQCNHCMAGEEGRLTVASPQVIKRCWEGRGKFRAYLGSRTRDNTSLFNPWEKSTAVPLIHKASNLREVIGWFVEPSSAVARSILGNLQSLTGHPWEEDIGCFRQSGCGSHRYQCSRQSNGGFIASSPNAANYLICSTDTLGFLRDKNYDFMFQALILYGQMVAATYLVGFPHNHEYSFHFHLSCSNCVREVEEFILTSPTTLDMGDQSHIIKMMTQIDLQPVSKRKMFPIQKGNWSKVPWDEQSFHVGRAQGFLFCMLESTDRLETYPQAIFPFSLVNGLSPWNHLNGLLSGLRMGAVYRGVYHRDAFGDKAERVFDGALYDLVSKFCRSSELLAFIDCPAYLSVLAKVPHKIPGTYPASQGDLASLVKSFLWHLEDNWTMMDLKTRKWEERCWLFSDLMTTFWAGMFVGLHGIRNILSHGLRTKGTKELVRTTKNFIQSLLVMDNECPTVEIIKKFKYKPNTQGVLLCDAEIRYCMKSIGPLKRIRSQVGTGLRIWGNMSLSRFDTVSLSLVPDFSSISGPDPPSRSCVLGSALRVCQLTTGAYLKVHALIKKLVRISADILVAGDGSGGLTAMTLRLFPASQVIFNTLFCTKDINLRGAAPGPPAALNTLSTKDADRCVNKNDCWENPSDLTLVETWDYFIEEKVKNKLTISLMILDMELTTISDNLSIISNLDQYLPKLLELEGTLIFKSFYSAMVQRVSVISVLGKYFRDTYACTSEHSGTFTSEFYIVFSHFQDPTKGHTFLDRSSLVNLRNNCYAYRTDKQEYQRALNIPIPPQFQGIPPELIPSLRSEIVEYLARSGVESGLAVSIYRTYHAMSRDPHSKVTGAALLGIFSAKAIFKSYLTDKDDTNIPTDARLSSLFCIVLGVWFYIGWISRDLDLIGSTQDLYENTKHITLNRRRRLIKVKGSKERKSQYSSTWTFGKQTEKNFSKPIRRHTFAPIANLIRMLVRDFHNQGETDIRNNDWKYGIDGLCRSFDEKFSLKSFLYKTDFFRPLLGDEAAQFHIGESISVKDIDVEREDTPDREMYWDG